jgi:hypothetical protein
LTTQFLQYLYTGSARMYRFSTVTRDSPPRIEAVPKPV